MNYGPKTVTNGLVLCLDAADKNSYPIPIVVYSVQCYSVYNGGLRSANYTVQYSDDNSTWTTAFTGVMSNNSSCGIITGTGVNTSNLTPHRYWRYVEGSAIAGHHPRVSRIDFIATNGTVYNLVTYTSDNCVDSGTYIVGTVSNDFGPSTWTDVSNNGNSVIFSGSPTFSNGIFTLNAVDQYFYVNTQSGFFNYNTNSFYADNTTTWTVTSWFKFPVSPQAVRDSTVNGGNCSYAILGKSGGIGGAETITLFVSANNNTTSAGSLYPYLLCVGIRGTKTQISPGSVNTNTWNNVAVTWDGTAGRVYLNGADRGALNIGTAGIQTSAYLCIGCTANQPSNHGFEGNISQVSVYSRSLSATEVLQNYNATKGRFGL